MDALSKAWLAEGWSRGFTAKQLIAANPFPLVTSSALRSELRALESSPNAELIQSLCARLATLEWQARLRRTFGDALPGARRIRSVARLGRRSFFKEHYATMQPVRITAMMKDWKAVRGWSPASLRRRFGAVPVKVAQNRDTTAFYDLNVHEISGETTFGAWVDWVEATRFSNHAYLVANNNGLSGPLRAMVNDIGFFRGLMNPLEIDGFVYLWYGPGGTVTPLHHDTTNIILCQVRGQKRITLIDPAWAELLRDRVAFYSLIDLEAPDLRRFPYFADIPLLTTTLSEGQALFIPAGWWHFVRALSVSISISMTNFAVPNTNDSENNMPGGRLR